MNASLTNILIGIALYLGVVAALLAVLGGNREQPRVDNNGAINESDNLSDVTNEDLSGADVSEQNSTHAAHIVIHPVDSQCDGPDTVINSKESCLNGANSAAIPTDGPLIRAVFPLQFFQSYLKERNEMR